MTEILSTKILLLFQKRPTKRRIVTQFWLFSFVTVMCRWVVSITLVWFECLVWGKPPTIVSSQQFSIRGQVFIIFYRHMTNVRWCIVVPCNFFAFVLRNYEHRNITRSIFSNQSQVIKLVSYTYCFSIFVPSRTQEMSASESGLAYCVITRIIVIIPDYPCDCHMH